MKIYRLDAGHSTQLVNYMTPAMNYSTMRGRRETQNPVKYCSSWEIVSGAQYLHRIKEQKSLFWKMRRMANEAESLIGVLTETRKLAKKLESLTRLSSDALLVLLLIHSKRPSSVKELTGYLGVSDSRTSKLLCTLEDRGFITRRISLTDRRVEQISLTPRGDRIVEIALSVPATLKEETPPGWPLNIEPSINLLGILIGCAAIFRA